jgi:hypothetical protein
MLEVKVTLLPVQKFVGPPAVITGVDGKAFTVTIVATDEALWHPLAFATFTVYVPAVVIPTLAVVAPFDHR